MEKDIKNIEDKLSFANYIKNLFNLPDTDIKSYSPLTLAYIGDSVYDLVIKTTITWKGNAPVNKLHKKVTSIVKATAQAEHYHMIENMLTEEEMAVYKRGRNAKSFTSAKNAGVVEYRTATGLEALIGYMYLTGKTERIMEIMKPVIEQAVSIS
ncbi:MAG TPA: ribonuclease III [Clostridiales bacterium]|nr:ribonuclease III [Clostridiales bacterium]